MTLLIDYLDTIGPPPNPEQKKRLDGIWDKIVACSNAITEADIKLHTCPECAHHPLDVWVIPGQTSWRECCKCKWTDKPDNVEIVE